MKITQPENTKHGFIPDEIIYGTDYVFGSSVSLGNKKKFAGAVLEVDGDWEKKLFPEIYSHQAPGYETNACTIFTLLNAAELLNYRVHGTFLDLSERDVAVGAGVDPKRGATFKKGAEWFRKNWALFESEWPIVEAATVEQFYTPVPSNLRAQAKERGKKYTFGYEFISNVSFEKIEEILPYGPVGYSTAYLKRSDGLYEVPDGWRDTHAVLALKCVRENGLNIIRTLDSYSDETGSFLKDIIFHTPESAVRFALDEQKYDLLSQLLGLLKKLYEALKSSQSSDKITNTPESKVIDYITPFALAIQEFEGFTPGSKSFRFNNPGNIKNSLGEFIQFTSYDEGFLYLKNYIKRACTGEHRAYKPSFTIRQFVEVYAPDPEPIPTNYANFIAKKLGVYPSKKIGELV